MQETIVDSQDSMSAARFADQQSKTGMPQHIQAPVAVAPVAQQQQVDPAAALPIKRLKEKSVKWDTDILPTLPKAEWLGAPSLVWSNPAPTLTFTRARTRTLTLARILAPTPTPTLTPTPTTATLTRRPPDQHLLR